MRRAAAATLVGVDWGTTRFRAYLMDARGTVLDRRTAQAGILQVGAEGFEAAFEREVGPWLDAAPDLGVVLSGMIGSRQGWVEVPYLECPADARALAGALHPHRTGRGRSLRFVPGLLARGRVPDVLRGEETQILGALEGHPDAAVLVLPGTHSKWARAAKGTVTGFATYMTGEAFGALKDHTILGRLMRPPTAPFAAAAFARGAGLGLDADPAGGGLLHRLFGARTLPLLGELAEAEVESFLSGLLIGTEAREALGMAPVAGEVVLVGRSGLVARYQQALALAGVRAVSATPDAAARGHATLARLAGLLG